MKRLLYALLVIGVLLALFGWLYISTQPKTTLQPAPSKTATFVFNCSDSGESITATFHIPEDNSVDLLLSDGRKINLPHALSGSGARYANADESFVFWNKGQTAFITERGNTTFANCQIETK